VLAAGASGIGVVINVIGAGMMLWAVKDDLPNNLDTMVQEFNQQARWVFLGSAVTLIAALLDSLRGVGGALRSSQTTDIAIALVAWGS
jgi:hypothetical protein